MNPFDKIDNISLFKNPDFNSHFRYKNNVESVDMAQKVFNEIKNTNIKNVVFIESGTSPLVQIIKILPEYQKSDINFHQIKVPRDLDFCLLSWFEFYLNKNELNQIIFDGKSRLFYLKKLCEKYKLNELINLKEFNIFDSINDNFEYNFKALSEFNDVLEGTTLHKIFRTQFLVFDEYINAGTIIRNLNVLIKLFNIKAEYKLSAFCMFLKNPESMSKIAFTLYDKNTEYECYKDGAYPFENRIDLIGYYYKIGSNFEKIFLENLLKEFNEKQDISEFYDFLEQKINDELLTQKLRYFAEQEQVKKYIQKTDVARYIIKNLEKMIFGNTKYYELLDQVFEIYAPAWSPMPVVNHLDYWNAFEKLNQEIIFDENIINQYKKYRKYIFNEVISTLIKNRRNWLCDIKKILEKKYENN